MIVIKYGGSLLEDPGMQKKFLEQIAMEWKIRKGRMALVHGGGKEITRKMEQAGLTAKFINGRRYTDDKTMEVVEKALHQLNDSMVKQMVALGVQAVGYSGKENHWLQATPIVGLGRAGAIPDPIDAAKLNPLLRQAKLPIFYSVGEDAAGQTLNINADEFAQALAIGCGAERLIFLTDSGGVLDESKQLISVMTSRDVERLIGNETITGGMIVKAQACLAALQAGVGRVIIGDQVSHTEQDLVVHGTSFILYNFRMTKSFEKWVRLSEYRMRSACVLHESEQHLDAVFNFQQAIEFMLKAWIVQRNNQNPPRTHNLLELAALLDVIPLEQRRILDELHDVSVPLRYPDDLDEAIQAYTYDEVKRIGGDVKGFLQWLKQKLN